MAATQRAAAKVDWSRISSSLGLRGSTANSLAAFKKRNDDARRRLQALSEQPTTVDFASYRQQLKNTQIVDEVEQRMKAVQVQKYDVGRQLKAIESFEVQAVRSAEETSRLVESELKDLAATLKNIETARPFEECTTDDVQKAEPEIERKVEHMVKNHRWMPAGYREKFGDLAVL